MKQNIMGVNYRIIIPMINDNVNLMIALTHSKLENDKLLAIKAKYN